MAVGLLREGINEVIATTRDNAAPMGIICKGNRITLVVYRASHTAARIRETGWLVANFIFDPILYVKTAFEDLSPGSLVSECVNGKIVQHLPDAEAWVVFDATVETETRHSIVVALSIVCEVIGQPLLHPVNRGFNSIIEATVHATRYMHSHDPALHTLIMHHMGLVKKCGGPRELEALDLLIKYMGEGGK